MTQSEKTLLVRNYDNDVSRGPHRLKVVSYSDTLRAHVCEFNGRQTALVDLLVDGSLPEHIEAEELVGKSVDVDYSHGFIWIASRVRLVEDEAHP